jgi:hypothetical protein
MKRNFILSIVLIAVSCAMAVAQSPTVTVDPSQHVALAAAQQSIVQAFASITEAQRNNDAHLGGHAGRAKELLIQANQELGLAADFANNNEPPSGPGGPGGPGGGPPQGNGISNDAPVQNLSGNWTIYADNAKNPGSSLKEIQLTQTGNILSGTYHGPHQHGKLQGWVNGNNVQFSTDTRDVLTFEGQITSTGMSGLYTVNGSSAPWNAQRSN